MKEARIWMPLYVSNYLSDTAHLRITQSGAYLHLIMHYWLKGSLPNDDQQLATIVKMTDREWMAVRPALAPFFEPGWKHKRVERELKEASEKYERRAKAGRQGAHQRYGSNVTSIAKGNGGGNA